MPIDNVKPMNHHHHPLVPIPPCDDHYDLLWREIATALVCGSTSAQCANSLKREGQECFPDSGKTDRNQDHVLPQLIALSADNTSHEQPVSATASLLTTSDSPQI